MHAPLLDLYYSLCCKTGLKVTYLDYIGVHSAMIVLHYNIFYFNTKVVAGRIKAYTDSLMLTKNK